MEATATAAKDGDIDNADAARTPGEMETVIVPVTAALLVSEEITVEIEAVVDAVEEANTDKVDDQKDDEEGGDDNKDGKDNVWQEGDL
ncbi:unnamed protein product [Dibothriocephalus latus]|uniref:Uncharacterized protein n=1 Tax=Dibothriocephalus latus TaxID=60516 RepID=A0A3P7NNX1_DIBLA|nr:unnamed protein product [Dibothriocephalus latus]